MEYDLAKFLVEILAANGSRAVGRLEEPLRVDGDAISGDVHVFKRESEALTNNFHKPFYVGRRGEDGRIRGRLTQGWVEIGCNLRDKDPTCGEWEDSEDIGFWIGLDYR